MNNIIFKLYGDSHVKIKSIKNLEYLLRRRGDP